ncbi:MAG: ATP-grasp domain-containing protein [Planctomycetes bacterium]|nr:ATP-grasp domain-containing protein [Planctomycetota bacterium]
MLKTIFMTGGGGSGTIAAAKCLKETGKYRIILGDADKWAAGLKFADKSYVLPAGKDERFIDVMKNLIAEEKVDVLVPLVDAELLKSYEIKKYFPNLMILLPEYYFTKTVLDKWLLFEKLKECHLPYPKTHLFSEGCKDLDYPFILKPRSGCGSRNVMEIKSRQQQEAYKIVSGLPEDEILIQEKIKGREFTVSVVVNKNGEVLAVVPKEVIYKRGITITAITRKNNDIQNLCQQIQKKFKANGPFNVQLILRDDGVPIVFEINPRYSTTIALTMEAGVNEIDVLIENKKYSGKLLPFKENLIMSRFYDQLYFEED